MADVSEHVLIEAMEIHVDLLEKVDCDIEKGETESVIETLQHISSALAMESVREVAPRKMFKLLDNLLKKSRDDFERNSGNLLDGHNNSSRCVAESFRVLRNSCANCRVNQNEVGDNTELFNCTRDIIRQRLERADEANDDNLVTVRCAIQFIGNAAVNNSPNQERVMKIFESVFPDLLKHGDPKLFDYSCMVIHNCYFSVNRHEIPTIPTSIIDPVIRYVTSHDSIHGMCVLEDIISTHDFLAISFSQLADEHKLCLLEVCLNSLENTRQNLDSKITISKENMSFLRNDLKENGHNILSLCTDKEPAEPVVIVKELEILGIASALEDRYDFLKDDKDLLICVVNMLKGIHDIGKQGLNRFTPVEKLSQAHTVEEDDPVNGLRRDCVRLIGNLVHKHEQNQDLVGEMEGLQLILDQTNIDVRNPWITQWAIFAVHNLCEDNNKNKGILAQLKMEGVANQTVLLEDFGIETEVRGDKIVVKRDGSKGN